MMEFSPHLKALQQLPGRTYCLKSLRINEIAEKIIEDSKNFNKPIEVHPSGEIPESLIPFVQLKIAEILKNPEGIINALKSDDPIIFNSALQVRWFYNGTTGYYSDAHYFQHHVFPYVSMANRTRIFKTLASKLTIQHSKYCEEFYSTISELYGKLEAQPFLINCSESFVEHIITQHEIKFDVKELKVLMSYHYRLAIKYLKLCVSNSSHPNNTYPPLETYHASLSYLLKYDIDSFVELIKNYDNSSSKIQLGRLCTEIFVNYQLDILIEKPHLFLPILVLNIITEKLSKSEFAKVFRNIFPRDIKEFDFKNLYHYLKYIPEDEKLPLMLSTFEEVYQVGLLDCDDKITPEVLKVLPSSERINQARKKLMNDKNWYAVGDKTENSWVCYLPTEESIPIIKKQIYKTNEHLRRAELVNQMIYTCKINNDINTLLDVLKYVTTQHKNEGSLLLDFFKRLPVDFQMQYLPEEHWEVLNEFIDHYHDKTKKRYTNEEEFQDIVIWGIHHDLVCNLSINKKIDIVTEGNINGRYPRWNLFKETPEFEKLCIEKFMESILRVYLNNLDNCSRSWPDIVCSIMEAIYNFNKRNSMNEVESISIKSNPLFLKEVQKLISGHIQNQEFFPKFKQMKLLLKHNEADLYYLWVEEFEKPRILINGPLTQIENAYDHYLENWEDYYEHCKSQIDDKNIQYFLHSSRWYQDLPIKFLERCLKDIIDDKDNNAVRVLAILVEGPVFEEFINSQTSNFTDIAPENSTEKRLTRLAIAEALKIIYTLPSIEFIVKVFDGYDYEVIHKCFIKIGYKIPADKLMLFCQNTMNRLSGINKLNINLLHDTVTTKHFRQILMDLWRTREQRLIDLCLIKNILDTFISNPCAETWSMVQECFTDLTINDQRALKIISSLDKIPNEYIASYVKLLLVVFRVIGNDVNSFGPEGVWFYTENLLQNISSHSAKFFTEEQHEGILKTYLADLSLPKDILIAAQRYLINCFILPAGDKLDSRLKFFLDLFVNILQNEQEIYDPDDCTPSYPVHNFLQGLINNIIPIPHSPVKIVLINAILDTYLTVLEPQDAPEFYCKFILASLHDDKTSPREFGSKISVIVPGLIDSSIASVFLISRSLFDLLYKFYLNFEAKGQLDIVESLLESNHDNNTLLAANFLLWQYFEMKNLSRFWRIVRVLKNHQNVAVVSCANLILSGFKY